MLQLLQAAYDPTVSNGFYMGGSHMGYYVIILVVGVLGYIVQARCPSAEDKGFVFLNCNITHMPGVAAGSMTLARSGGSKDYYDNVAYINCKMSSVIPAKGWHGDPEPNPAKGSAASGWKEYGSMDGAGVPLTVTGRLSASYQLTDAEYEAGYKDRIKIFEGTSVGTEWLK